jgi:hypothetical protein
MHEGRRGTGIPLRSFLLEARRLLSLRRRLTRNVGRDPRSRLRRLLLPPLPNRHLPTDDPNDLPRSSLYRPLLLRHLLDLFLKRKPMGRSLPSSEVESVRKMLSLSKQPSTLPPAKTPTNPSFSPIVSLQPCQPILAAFARLPVPSSRAASTSSGSNISNDTSGRTRSRSPTVAADAGKSSAGATTLPSTSRHMSGRIEARDPSGGDRPRRSSQRLG